MIRRLNLSAEQETFLALTIKIKSYSCLLKNHGHRFTQVDFTGIDREQYYMLKFSRKTFPTIKFLIACRNYFKERSNILYQKQLDMYISLI